MKKKILIVVANYYKAISNGLFYSASDEINRINKRPVFLLNETKKISAVDESFANNIVKIKIDWKEKILLKNSDGDYFEYVSYKKTYL